MIDEDGLLAEYVREAEALMRPQSLRVGVTWQDAVEGLAVCGRTWDAQGTAWAVSGPVAAAVMAPLLTSVRSAIVYVDADTAPRLEVTAAQVGLQAIEGGRLTLAPWPRVFADLQRSGVRGEEAAEHLREVVGG